MGINRLLIDSRIQGIWHGHTKTGRGRLRTGRSGGWGTRRLTRHASLQQQSARWVVAPMTLWVVRPLQCRSHYTDANATAGDCAQSI